MATPSRPQKKRKTTPRSGPSPAFFNLTQLTPEQKDRMGDLKKRTISTTQFAAPRTLKRLKLTAPVTALLSRVGLDGFLDKRASTYAQFTLEFLSTLEKDVNQDLENYITFNLNDVKYEMTYNEIREAFGWTDMSRGDYLNTTDFNAKRFFSDITGGLKFNKNSLISSLPHPAVRFCSYLLAGPVLCQGELTKLPQYHLKLLWAMSPAGTARPDMAALWVDSCLDLRAVGKKTKITMGGMVTLLYKFLNRREDVPDDQVFYPPAKVGKDEHDLLTYGKLQDRHMVWYEPSTQQFTWRYGPNYDFYIDLPQPSRTTLRNMTRARHLYILPDARYKGNIQRVTGLTLEDPPPNDPNFVEAEDDEEINEDEVRRDLAGHDGGDGGDGGGHDVGVGGDVGGPGEEDDDEDDEDDHDEGSLRRKGFLFGELSRASRGAPTFDFTAFQPHFDALNTRLQMDGLHQGFSTLQ